MRKEFLYAINELRAGSLAKKQQVFLRKGKLLRVLLEWLQACGYIHGFSSIQLRGKKKSRINHYSHHPYYCVILKFFESGHGLLDNIKTISKLKKKLTIKVKGLNKNNINCVILSHHGFINARTAKKLHVGGTLIFKDL